MSNSLGKNELISAIADKTGIPKTSCEMVYEAYSDEICNALIDGRKVVLKGFMIFEPTIRKARSGRNPKTGEIEKFPAVRTVNCRISEAIKDEMNRK